MMQRPPPEDFSLKETRPHLGGGKITGDKLTSTYDLVEQMQYLYVRVVKAKELPGKDLTGSCDPYVEVKLGNYKGTTRHFEKKSNPEWNQVFAFSKDRIQASFLEATVKDKDVVKDDLIGRVVFDLNEVPKRVPPDSPLAPQWYRLEGTKGEKVRGELMLAVWFGTQADEAFPEAWHSDAATVSGTDALANIRSKVYLSPKLWYLRVNVIEAQDLIPSDKGRYPEVYVKAIVGNQALRTRVSQSRTINPMWNEDLMFVAAEPFEEPLILSVEDRVAPNKDEVLGRCAIPLQHLDKRFDHRPVNSRWFNLEKHIMVDGEKKEIKFASRIHMRICLEGGYHVLDESTHYSSDLRPTAKQLWKPNIGVLELGILNATGLMPMKNKDGRGTTDAYCVAKYGQKWIRTRTIIDSFTPRWNEQYTWEVFDPCTVITVGVFDNCHLHGGGEKNGGGGKDSRIGKVRIRLSTLETDRVYTHSYPLLVLHPNGVKKMGEIHLAVRFTCSSLLNMMYMYSVPLLPKMHYIHPLTVSQLDNLRHQATQIVSMRLTRAEPPLRKEVVEYMLDVGSHMWSMRRSKANFFRIMGVLSGLIAVGKWFEQICNWKNPITTVLIHLLFIILVVYPELILPTVFLYLFLIGVWYYRWRAQTCIEMTSAQLRATCESIVQDLTKKMKQCQAGLVKWFVSQLLFILTHCTRVVMFQKETEPIDENSFRKFKECLENIPALETNWVSTSRVDDAGKKFKKQDKESLESEATLGFGMPDDQSNNAAREGYGASKQGSRFNSKVVEQRSYLSNEYQDKMPNDPSGKELGGWDSVICRICEEEVTLSHLEPHSYICAYADKCEINCLDVDERLLKLEEILEQIIDSRSSNSFHPQAGGLENSVLQKSGVASEGCSPKVNEWRNKGVEGMFEDLHEMDTAFIDESNTFPINLKSHVGAKFCHHGTSSSTGSITSVSSTNTPRTSHFDSYWLERHSPEQEDLQLMMDLSDIARCGASTDLSKEGSCDYLLACMQDIQAVLKQSKLKALVIDTFGGRIEKLLCEKYMYACDLIGDKSSTGNVKESESVSEHASQGSAMTTPHFAQKERTSIDDFEIIKPISRGAFGKVFLARKRTTGDFFAIKVLKKLDMIRKNDFERILEERNILITVRYPFVVRFFYSFTCSDNLYLVMEYLNGGDLYSLLQKVGCLDDDIARIYIAELVLALEYLHSLNIVHRDIKPDNLLIAHDGHIKLTDFGLSKIGLINNTIDLSGPESDASPRKSSRHFQKSKEEERIRHSAVGTPDYLAPEILLGTEHGYAADWWSVGIILFELITGIPPFTAARPEIIFDNILNGKMPWPDVPGQMSYEAQDLINRFLVHEPEKRLGANGAAEVKSHPFFRGVDWENLAMQKAAFVPQPESIHDTSYFVSRFGEKSCSDSDTDNDNESYPNSGDELDECTNLADFDSPPCYLSFINFSFKNLSQLASINHDVLLQKDPAKGGGGASPFNSHGT